MEIRTRRPRSAGMLISLVFYSLCFFAGSCNALPVFINEIHYDNSGADVDEAVEIAGPAGTDLTDWWLLLYNGSSGDLYRSIALSGAIPDLGAGTGFVALRPSGGLQNGPMDGLALLDSTGQVLQFLSYEGSLRATGGPAAGLVSTDIGLFETGATAVGESLQLSGTGSQYGDFHWVVGNSSFNAVNDSQRFLDRSASAPVPTPGNLVLVTAGLITLLVLRSRAVPGAPRRYREKILMV